MRKVINEYEVLEKENIHTAKEENPEETSAVLSTTVGCLRGAMLVCVGIVFALCGALAVGASVGFFAGLFAGVCLLMAWGAFTWYWTRNVTHLTVWDCILPIPVGLLSAVLFTPISAMLNASFFSAVTCLSASVFLSMVLLLYRSKKIGGFWLIFPFLVFMYEVLPIEFPSDLDNMLAFGGNIINTVAAISFDPVLRIGKRLLGMDSASAQQ